MIYEAKVKYVYTDGAYHGYISGSWDEILRSIQLELSYDSDMVEAYVVEAIEVATGKIKKFSH